MRESRSIRAFLSCGAGAVVEFGHDRGGMAEAQQVRLATFASKYGSLTGYAC